MKLRLRAAVHADLDLLFEWANEASVRANAFRTEKISYEDHVRWFEKMMADAEIYQYILCEGERPVGQIRINVEGCEALIDYSVASGERGKGYGSEMLLLVQEQLAKDQIRDVAKLVGQVKYENHASSRAFEKSGFAKKELPDYILYEKKTEE